MSEVISDRRANDHAALKNNGLVEPDPKRVRKLHYRAVLGWLAATQSNKMRTYWIFKLIDNYKCEAYIGSPIRDTE